MQSGLNDERGALAEAETAFEQMQRRRPNDAWINRQLGLLRLKQEKKSGAQLAFAAALAASPTDAAAAHNLLELQLEVADLTGAEATLGKMRLHQPGAATLAAEVLVQLRQRRAHVPREAFETLCASPDPDPWPVNTAADAMNRAGQRGDALRLMQRAIKSGRCNPQLGAAVVGLLTGRDSLLSAVWFFLRLKPGEVQHRAAAPLLQNVAQLKTRGQLRLLLRVLLWRRRAVLSHNDTAWGMVGFALSNLGQMKQVARWLSDWRQRPDVQPWMLFNYCVALRHLRRYPEATEVAAHVVKTWGHREGAADLHLFLAVETALAGDVTAAQDHLTRVVVREEVQHDKQLLALAKALTDFQLLPRAERRQGFATVRAQLAIHFGDLHTTFSLRDVRRTLRRARGVFQREGAGISSWLWCTWKLDWQWLLLLIVPVAVKDPTKLPFIAFGLIVWGLTRWQD